MGIALVLEDQGDSPSRVATEAPQEPEFVMTGLMRDEAWEALVDLDSETLGAGDSYWWSEKERCWKRSVA